MTTTNCHLHAENPAYLTSQLLTYLGNKRALLPMIDQALRAVHHHIGRPLRMCDMFAGSGVVARLMKTRAAHIVANDLESYARVTNECYLQDATTVDWPYLTRRVHQLNAEVAAGLNVNGYIENHYAPHCDNNIQPGERVFYTRDNARRLDAYRALINQEPAWAQPLLLGPLLAAASVHANTSGIFKAFHKDRHTGLGKFGGSNADALSRIKGTITLDLPVLSNFNCPHQIFQQDANELAKTLDDIDVAYLDPPYNQHPYGSNYFMLNLLADAAEPQNLSEVSGIPADWNRSGYNVRKKSLALFEALVTTLRAKYLLVSFNNEGFIQPQQLKTLLESIGHVQEFETRYNTYRGCRNFAGRSAHVTEHLYLVATH